MQPRLWYDTALVSTPIKRNNPNQLNKNPTPLISVPPSPHAYWKMLLRCIWWLWKDCHHILLKSAGLGKSHPLSVEGLCVALHLCISDALLFIHYPTLYSTIRKNITITRYVIQDYEPYTFTFSTMPKSPPLITFLTSVPALSATECAVATNLANKMGAVDIVNAGREYAMVTIVSDITIANWWQLYCIDIAMNQKQEQ